jgi:hypothetical protein
MDPSFSFSWKPVNTLQSKVSLWVIFSCHIKNILKKKETFSKTQLYMDGSQWFYSPQLLDIVTSNRFNWYVWVCSYKEIKCWRRINPLMLALVHFMDLQFLTYCWPMHCIAVNAFNGTVNVKALVLDSTWNFNPVNIEEWKEK